MIIAGLGNPGREYAFSRHNLGFMAIDVIAGRWKTGSMKRKFNASIAEGRLAGRDYVLMKPYTMMNLSGTAIKKAISFYGLGPSDLLVLCDDLNLALGEVRLRRKGSSGGHNGLESVIEELNTPDFARLRMGIGLPLNGEDASDFVLADFSDTDEDTIKDMINRAAKTAELLLVKGIEKAMQWSNKRRVC